MSKGEKSREHILETAQALIAEKGFNAVTVQDVLDAAKVTKGKFFHHFESKDDLFGQLLRQALSSRAVHRFDEIVKECESQNPLDKIIFILDRLIEWHKSGLPEGMRLCLFATFFFSPQSPEMKDINKRLSANARVVENLIREAQEKEMLPTSLNAETLSLLFPSAAVGGNIIGFLCGKNKLTAENIVTIKNVLLLLGTPLQKGKVR